MWVLAAGITIGFIYIIYFNKTKIP